MKENSNYLHMSFFSRGKLQFILKDVAKKSASTRKKSGKKQTQAGSKKHCTKKKPVTKSKKKAVFPKKHQEKTVPKEPKKAKVKSVNSSAPSDMETETQTSAETEIHNDSIDLSSEGEKEVNGGVEKQNDDSDLNKQPEKTKDSCSEGEKKLMDIFKHVVRKMVRMVDLGANSDCSELESKSEDESQTGTNIEPKVSVQGEIKEKGGVEPPESSV